MTKKEALNLKKGQIVYLPYFNFFGIVDIVDNSGEVFLDYDNDTGAWKQPNEIETIEEARATRFFFVWGEHYTHTKAKNAGHAKVLIEKRFYPADKMFTFDEWYAPKSSYPEEIRRQIEKRWAGVMPTPNAYPRDIAYGLTEIH